MLQNILCISIIENILFFPIQYVVGSQVQRTQNSSIRDNRWVHIECPNVSRGQKASATTGKAGNNWAMPSSAKTSEGQSKVL